jgi:hypothetical protein
MEEKEMKGPAVARAVARPPYAGARWRERYRSKIRPAMASTSFRRIGGGEMFSACIQQVPRLPWPRFLLILDWVNFVAAESRRGWWSIREMRWHFSVDRSSSV